MSALNPGHYVRDLKTEGRFLVHRDIFRDPAVLDWEMKHIFESTWSFVGLASQLPGPHDFLTTWIGRQPVVVSRDEFGKLHCFLNTCRHRGSILCHTSAGNAKHHVCRYHGWAYDSAGKCVHIKDESEHAYNDAFRAKNHDLVSVPHFGQYRGFLFASLSDDCPDLDEYLGGTTAFLDLIVDQSLDGLEIVPGVGVYTFDANWKLQIENCLDAYHFTTTHASLLSIVRRRKSGASENSLKPVLDYSRMNEGDCGAFTFKYGHAAVWTVSPNSDEHLLQERIDEIRHRVGSAKADWMLRMRNLSLFPNVQFADNGSLQLRIIRPLTESRTEMRTYCLAPVGETAQTRARRIRLYEDFFNSTGLATPDDTQVYEDCQTGYRAWGLSEMQGYDRGVLSVRSSPDRYAQSLGIFPETSLHGPFELQDETLFHSSYREWLRLMIRGAAGEQAPQT